MLAVAFLKMAWESESNHRGIETTSWKCPAATHQASESNHRGIETQRRVDVSRLSRGLNRTIVGLKHYSNIRNTSHKVV